MASFGQIYATTRRYAENADARLDIRRQDPDQQKRQQNEEGEQKKLSFNTYDEATVSVSALKAFLENFVNELLMKSSADAHAGVRDGVVPSAPAPATSPSAKAAGLYKSAARATEPAPPPARRDETAILNEDVRLIHLILQDIEALRARGVEFIALEQSDTFLNSLAAAAKKALASG